MTEVAWEGDAADRSKVDTNGNTEVVWEGDTIATDNTSENR